jgi:hypothetical protein
LVGPLVQLVVATESAATERVVTTGEGSSADPPPPEVTEGLSPLLPRAASGVGADQPSGSAWSEVKSKRGRKKRYATQGYACLNPACPYYGIIDETIHALVRHTSRGKDRDIPYLCCQCCRTVFTSRKGTPLYHLKAK